MKDKKEVYMDKQEIIKNIALRTGGDIYFGVANSADSAAVTYRIPTANDGYNKKGILIKRVAIVDAAYINENYKDTINAEKNYDSYITQIDFTRNKFHSRAKQLEQKMLELEKIILYMH